MKAEEINTVDLPSYAPVYLEYGDHSGLETVDILEIDAWREGLEREAKGQLIFQYGEGSYFSTTPAFGLPADCIECKIVDLY
jgi:hypothetical protein